MSEGNVSVTCEVDNDYYDGRVGIFMKFIFNNVSWKFP
jgi:hypothetical protein